MEDRYGALTKRKETFTRVVDTAVKVGTTAGGELRDEAQMLVEYIKEYYMNYPLRAQPNSVTGCLFDELEFYSLPEDSIKAFHRSFRPETAKSRSDIKLLDKASSPAADAPAKEPATETASSPVAESLTPEHKKESGSAELYEMLKVGSPMVLSSLAGAEDLSASVGRGAEDRARTNRVLAQGLSQSTAALMETEYHNVWKAKTVHLGFGNEAIVSIVRAPYAESRIIVRDLTGKHAWIVTEHRAVDFGCLDTIDYNDKAAVYKNVLNLKGDKKLIKDIITSGKSEPASEEKAKPEYTPQSKETIEEELKRIEGTDTFTRVVSLLTKHCADTKLFKDVLENWEKQQIAHNAKGIEDFEAQSAKLEQSEAILHNLVEQESQTRREAEFRSDVRSVSKLYSDEHARFDFARALLCRLGDLEMLSSGGSAQVTLLNETNPDFRMLLKFLDSDCVLRRSIKLGVIYVGRGQFDQKSILYNTKGSAKYEELLRRLGQPLSRRDIQSMMAFQPEVLYHATATYELVFHVVTLMATNFGDAQQVEKKKYVGNDSVHIVWSENDREYKPGTITGAFNFAHIIIYPMRTGLYRVQIERKKDWEQKREFVQFFGPLITGMQIPMETLGALVRYTAINARRSITFKQLRMPNPMSERRKTLEKIVAKYAVQARTKGEQIFMLADKLMRDFPK